MDCVTRKLPRPWDVLSGQSGLGFFGREQRYTTGSSLCCLDPLGCRGSVLKSGEETMAEHIDEQISALEDGELSKDECKRLMEEMRADGSKVSCWGHYHLISDAL